MSWPADFDPHHKHPRAHIMLSGSDGCRGIAHPCYQIAGVDPQDLVNNALAFQRKRDIDNAKPLWWCNPDTAVITGELDIFGRRFLVTDERYRYAPWELRDTLREKYFWPTMMRLQRMLADMVTRYLMYGDLPE